MADALVVAALTSEDYAQSEISALVNILDAELLLGSEATSRNLQERLNQQKWRIVWFVGHGTEHGVSLYDGPIASGTLTSFIRNASPDLVVLNTCSSLNVAMDIYNEVATNFVCTIQETPDNAAFFMGKQLAINIARGHTFKESYLRSKSGQNRNYVFLPGANGMTGQDIEQRTPPSTRDGNGDIADLHEEVSRLSYLVYGNEQWQLPGIIPSMAKLQRDCNQVRLLLFLLIVLVLLSAAVALGRWWPMI
jgi:hypothetical protein